MFYLHFVLKINEFTEFQWISKHLALFDRYRRVVTPQKSVQLKKCLTDHLQTSTEGIKLMPEKVPISKTAALCNAVLELFNILGRGGSHLPSHWRFNLVWLFRRHRARCVVAMKAAPTWPWRWVMRLGYFRCQYQRRVFIYVSVNVGRCKSILVGRRRCHYMHCG